MNEVVGSKIEMIEIECKQKQIKTYNAVPLFTDQPCPNKNKNKINCNLLCLVVYSKWKKIEIKSKRVMLQPYYSSESREMLTFAFHG